METIFIICAGIEYQKDGIGDYTRTLADQFSKHYTVVVCAINDDLIYEITQEFNIYKIVRFPSRSSWSKRTGQLSKLLKVHQPVWVSLQLSPFGLQTKGIVYPAIDCLSCLNNYKVHIFVHELWLGAENGASIKLKLWGQLIKYYLIRLIKTIAPYKVYVSCELNQFLLRKEGIETEVEHIFSNIKYVKIEDDVLSDGLCSHLLITKEVLFSEYVLIGFFGIIHPYWTPDDIFNQLESLAVQKQKKLLFLFIGKIQPDVLSRTIERLPYGASHYTTGILDSKEISGFIQLCDAGITSNPEILLGKSGTVAAFLMHQKPVIVYPNDINVAGFKLNIPLSNLVLYPSQITKLLTLKIDAADQHKFESHLLVKRMYRDMNL